jgi:hypothetical protein
VYCNECCGKQFRVGLTTAPPCLVQEIQKFPPHRIVYNDHHPIHEDALKELADELAQSPPQAVRLGLTGCPLYPEKDKIY